MPSKCYSAVSVCVRVVGAYKQVKCITSQYSGQGGSF